MTESFCACKSVVASYRNKTVIEKHFYMTPKKRIYFA